MSAWQVQYLQPSKVAHILDVSKRHVYDLIRQGKLVAIKAGVRAIRVSIDSPIEFMRANKIDPADFFE